MKRTFPLGLLALAGAGLLLQAGDFTLDWWTVDAGGGTSTGGVYAVRGTIGQPDAGTLAGGDYPLTGGFWSILAVVPSPEAPTLTITRNEAGAVKLCWPAGATGWVLEETPDLTAPSWGESPLTPVLEGTNKCVTITTPVGSRFFRLHKP